jgi:hypothetical protein
LADAPLTVVCVLRPGGDFDASWVWALKRACNRHIGVPFEFRCITHVEALTAWRIRPLYDWPKWWSKLDVFRPGIFPGPVLYMDLDTLPVGDMSDIASYRGEFAGISDFYKSRKLGERAPLQSGVMAFTPGPVSWQLWERFVANPEGNMRRYRGDGEWIAAHVPKADRLQSLYPGQLVSYKADAKAGPPEGARLVCGHGRPRFNTSAAGWAHKEWSSLAFAEEKVVL